MCVTEKNQKKTSWYRKRDRSLKQKRGDSGGERRRTVRRVEGVTKTNGYRELKLYLSIERVGESVSYMEERFFPKHYSSVRLWLRKGG